MAATIRESKQYVEALTQELPKFRVESCSNFQLTAVNIQSICLEELYEGNGFQLVDVLLERLATLALDKVERELNLVTGVKKEIEKLTLKLEDIRALLEDAEQRQEMETSVKRWLNELNDVSFDMDDVLDEWITRVQKHQLEKQERHNAKKKVCFPISSSCIRFGQVDYQLFLRHEIAKKIEELNERLASIDERKQSLNLQKTTKAVPKLSQRQTTTSLPNDKTFGRDDEKNLIVSKLLSESSEGKEIPLIIPIVGMGGMGKTSLANLVYNDAVVKSHFDKIIWVCVSEPFDLIKIAQAIIEGLDKDNISNGSKTLQTLMQCIFELSKGKKFLLVLDNVWNPQSSQWEELIKPLRNGVVGSRVLVTTRNEEVVTLMKATPQMIPLKELGEPFCFSLFYYSADYYSADVDESSVSREFLDIGLKIVKKCNGLPLVAKTLRSLMRNKKNIKEWRNVLNSKTWELKEIENEVFQPLLLSYHDLDPAIRHCLLYCVLFPKDYMYDNNILIELWMSQDYLYTDDSSGNEVTGQNHFNELVRRSFFQDVKINDMNGKTTCKIHDIVHDFLQYMTRKECLILDFKLDENEKKKAPNDKLRHLALVHATKSDCFKPFLLSCKKLRTLRAIRPYNNSIGPIFELIVTLKSLRTLNLYTWSFRKVPESIGELIHLRNLDFSGNHLLTELPSTIGSLCNLQTLRLVSCSRLQKVYVGRLINLMHLYVRGCRSLRLIQGIEKLTHLQSLDEFRVESGGDEVNKFEHLKDLNQLQGSLDIVVLGEANIAKKASVMVNKTHHLEFNLYFPNNAGHDDQYSDDPWETEIMNGLEPHSSLESLTISEYNGDAFPCWLTSLHSLRVLTLENCEVLPPLGQLVSLESLSIKSCSSKVELEFLGLSEGQTASSSSSKFISFPSLKQLSFQLMWSWKEWELGVELEDNSENYTIMPCLSHLTIMGCFSLKSLPDFLWKTPLQTLRIQESPILQDLYRQGTGSEEWAKISHIPSIQLEDESR